MHGTCCLERVGHSLMCDDDVRASDPRSCLLVLFILLSLSPLLLLSRRGLRGNEQATRQALKTVVTVSGLALGLVRGSCQNRFSA